MNWDLIEANGNNRLESKAKWGKLTDDDMTVINGKKSS
jgi:uncharacterized protein YjbJ (UPF0337 family)